VGGRRAFHVLSIVTLACALPARAHADPQINAGVTVGGVVEDAVGPSPPSAAFHLGARADALFLRTSPRDMGIGPYLDVATSNFHNVDGGGGVEWLLPVAEDWPIVLSGGGFARNGAGRTWAPGVEGTVFLGPRSYNYHSVYGLAFGLFAQTRWVPASPSTMDLVFGVQVDAEILALPVLLAWGALSHGS
jgi:hypothetical protein